MPANKPYDNGPLDNSSGPFLILRRITEVLTHCYYVKDAFRKQRVHTPTAGYMAHYRGLSDIPYVPEISVKRLTTPATFTLFSRTNLIDSVPAGRIAELPVCVLETYS